MMFEPGSKNKVIILAIVLIVLLGGAFFFYYNKPKAQDNAVYCTQEAKQCPDGSYVGRSGPKCEFAACPAGNNQGNEQKPASSTKEFEFPKDLPTKYLQVVDWPPKVNVLDEPFTCTEAGKETQRAGMTSLVSVNGHSYCVTKETEGAAGSIYTQYAYAFAKGDKTIIFTFTTRMPQCENYDEPRKSECSSERSNFNINNFVDGIASAYLGS